MRAASPAGLSVSTDWQADDVGASSLISSNLDRAKPRSWPSLEGHLREAWPVIRSDASGAAFMAAMLRATSARARPIDTAVGGDQGRQRKRHDGDQLNDGDCLDLRLGMGLASTYQSPMNRLAAPTTIGLALRSASKTRVNALP